MAFAIICLSVATHAELQEVVYLKNGSIIRGMILEQIPNQSLKIRTADQSIFVFSMDDVIKITKEENPIAQPQQYLPVQALPYNPEQYGNFTSSQIAPVSPTEVAAAKEDYTSGASRQSVGRVMSWIGLGTTVLGSAIGSAPLAAGGSIALTVGIPLNGSGASQMVEASNRINPQAPVEMSGWGTYVASWVLMGLGVTEILIGSNEESSQSSYNNNNQNETMLLMGVVSVLTGSVMQYVAWGQFSFSADRAENKMQTLGAISFYPTVVPNIHGKLQPGAVLVGSF